MYKRSFRVCSWKVGLEFLLDYTLNIGLFLFFSINC